MSKGMSQSDLGAAVNVSFQQIQKYENGLNKIATDRLIELAAALDTTLDFFIGDLKGGESGEFTEIDSFMATRDGIDVAKAMIKLEPRHRRTVIELARSLGAAA
jgi:transcriptional regulator with XRE-family HTH domain